MNPEISTDIVTNFSGFILFAIGLIVGWTISQVYVSKSYYKGFSDGKFLGSFRGTASGVYSTLYALDLSGAIAYNEETDTVYRVLDNGKIGNEILYKFNPHDLEDRIKMDFLAGKVSNQVRILEDKLIDAAEKLKQDLAKNARRD
jgi:hypothetical protein